MAIKRKTDKEFLQEVFKLVGDEYEFLEEYRGADVKIKIIHKNCNNTYQVTPTKFINQGRRCPKCNGGIKVTKEMFEKIILEKRGKEYILIGEFRGYTKKVNIKHLACGHEWNVNGNYFINEEQECPECKKKRTIQEKTDKFKLIVKESEGDNYKVLGEYTSYNDPIKMFHVTCKNNYYVRPSHFISRNHRCPFCSKSRRKTAEEFKGNVYKKYQDEYDILGEYYNNRTPILIKHMTCGYEFKIPPREFLDKSKCPICSKNCQRFNTEVFELKMKNVIGEEYVVVGGYVDSRTKIKLKHKICNHEFDALPNHVLSRKTTRCPNCFGGIRINHDEFVKIIKEVHNDEFQILGTYKNSDTPLEVRHKLCNHIFYPIPHGFIRGTGCPKCAGILKLTHEEFVERASKFNKIDEFEFLERYSNNRTKIKVKHIPCGRTYDAHPSVLLRGGGCARCKESKGEKSIADYLEINKIHYDSQYRFEDCKNKNSLPFDFAIFDNGNSLMFLIEYDGEQHFFPIEYFGGEENLQYVQQNDSIKNTYCKNNNIPILRIPYWDYDRIEEILHNELSKYKLI